MTRDLFSTESRDLFSDENESNNKIDKNSSLEKINYITGSDRSPIDTFRDLVAGALGGVAKFGQKTANVLTGGHTPQIDMDEALAPIRSPNISMGGNLAKGIGEYLPYGIAGGATIPGMLAAGAAHGAATTNPDESNFFGLLPKGELGGAIEGALLNMIAPVGLKTLEKLRPSKMLRGNLTPEQLEKNLEITKGTETGLGDVIESPFLKKRLENTLPSIPFSGANESLQRTGNEVVKRGENIMDKLLGKNSPENVPAQLTENLINEFKSHQITKNNLYNEANNIADRHDLKLELPNFSKKANDVSDAIDSTNMLKFEPDIAKIFNKLKNYKNPVKEQQGAIIDVNGKPLTTTITTPTLKEANLLKGKLNEYAKTAGKSPDPAQRNMAKVFGELSTSLRNDIRSTINQSGNSALKSAYEKAEKNYANNFSPFLDKEIYKYISGSADPETIVQKFIKTSPNADLAAQLEKLATKTQNQSKRQSNNLLGYAYFSRALDNEGNLNPSKLATAIQKLGQNQLKALVPDPSLRKELLDYIKLQKMNKEAQYLMHNPKTGARNSDAIMTGLLALLGKMGAGDLGAIVGAGLPILAGKAMTKALTSESIRENLIKEMLRDRTKFNTPLKRSGGSALTQSIAKQLEGNE